METNKIAIFKGKKIRKILHQHEWWFSVVDVVEALTDSVNANDYWYKMKIRVKSDDGFELSTICQQLKLEAPDGKERETDCANTEGISGKTKNPLSGAWRLQQMWRKVWSVITNTVSYIILSVNTMDLGGIEPPESWMTNQTPHPLGPSYSDYSRNS